MTFLLIVIKNMSDHEYILICVTFCNSFLVIILFYHFEVSENIYFSVIMIVTLIVLICMT
jgi:hypothetical protein